MVIQNHRYLFTSPAKAVSLAEVSRRPPLNPLAPRILLQAFRLAAQEVAQHGPYPDDATEDRDVVHRSG